MLSSGRFNNGLDGQLKDMGLMNGLLLCLDAADKDSWPGGGTTWIDTSGQGNHMVPNGTTPAFNGQISDQSSNSYFQFSGSNSWKIAGAPPARFQNMHKAGAKFTIALWFYCAAIKPTYLMGDFSDLGGFDLYVDNSLGHPTISIVQGWNGTQYIYSQGRGSNEVVAANTWNFFGVSFDTVTGLGAYRYNTVSFTFADCFFGFGTYGAASVNDSTNFFSIGTSGWPTEFADSSVRIPQCAIWEGVSLTSEQLESLYNTGVNDRFPGH